MKVSFEVFDDVMIELFGCKSELSQNPREEIVNALVNISIILTGEIYRPGMEFPRPIHPTKLQDIRKNILIYAANQLVKQLDLPAENLQKAARRVLRLVENIYPQKERYIDVLDLPRG